MPFITKGGSIMKPNYKNWMPKGIIFSFLTVAIISLICFFIFGISEMFVHGVFRYILATIFLIVFLIFAVFAIWCIVLYRAFSYDGKRQLSKNIIEGIAKYLTLPENSLGLDIGCGSGALTIACAKRNPKSTIIGIDRWGKEYASFNKTLCENNAKAENVTNVRFEQGNAINLDFEDESFDAVMSNYVYHNIPGVNKQKLLLETLRVLKKGGIFVIHDLMYPSQYGDMQLFVENLKKNGYEKVELIDTTKNIFMNPKEAKWLMLKTSTLLVGKK